MPSLSRAAGAAVAAVTVIIWTSFIIVGRGFAHRSLTPFDVALARFAGAGAVMLPWTWWRSRTHPGPAAGPTSFLGLSRLSFRVTALIGVLAGWAYALLTYNGFVWAPAAHASVLLTGSLPLWTTIIAAWWVSDRVTAARMWGLACILVGDAFVGGTSLVRSLQGGTAWKGDLMFIAASLSWAGYTTAIRRYRIDPVNATVGITVFTSLTYVPAYAVLVALKILPSHLLTAPISEVLLQALFQGLGPVVIAGTTFTMMVGHFGAVRTTMIVSIVPGLSALAAVVILGEPLTWNLLAGLAFVTLGMVVGVSAGRRG
jgi:drug/metabolite transporter (DMT)-like permease